MTGPRIFVTGGGGFVGRRLLPQLRDAGWSVVALDRSGTLPSAGLTVVRGDVLTPATYREALETCTVVIHMAAATGKASRDDHFRVNAAGTKTLLEECRAARVPSFVFVSSIAVTFSDLGSYHYAQAKIEAESAVQQSGLDVTIVRPTIILGEGAPILTALEKLALLPVPVLPGNGRARVQPIHVDDVARALVMVVDAGAEAPAYTRGVFAIGGPEEMSIEDLVLRLRRARSGKGGRAVHIPLWLMTPPLRMAEAIGLGKLLPLTAGQLASFKCDGAAPANPLQAALAPELTDVDAMLITAPKPAVDINRPQVARDDRALVAECRVFTQYLAGAPVTPALESKYLAAHDALPLEPATAFDRVLLRFARLHPLCTRIADSYAALLARPSSLRKKLVLLLALLETLPPFHRAIDRAIGGPPAVAALKLGLRGAIAIAGLVAGLAVFVPLRLVFAILGRQAN